MDRLQCLTQLQAMLLEAPWALHDFLEERDSLQVNGEPAPSTCLKYGFVFYRSGPPLYYEPEMLHARIGIWPGERKLSCKASILAYREDSYCIHLVEPLQGASGGGGMAGRPDKFWTVHTETGSQSSLLFVLTIIGFGWFSHPAIDDLLGHLYTA